MNSKLKVITWFICWAWQLSRNTCLVRYAFGNLVSMQIQGFLYCGNFSLTMSKTWQQLASDRYNFAPYCSTKHHLSIMFLIIQFMTDEIQFQSWLMLITNSFFVSPLWPSEKMKWRDLLLVTGINCFDSPHQMGTCITGDGGSQDSKTQMNELPIRPLDFMFNALGSFVIR